MRGVEIEIPITTRRPTTAAPSRAVGSPALAPDSERRYVVVYLRGRVVEEVDLR